jgi:xylan 1,4-beta-xylosidase
VHDLHDMMFFMLLSPLFFATTTGAAAVDLAVDLAAPAKEFPHFWERCFGSGHALLGTRADWQEHMRLAVAELGMSGVRMHGVLDDDMSVAKCADPDPKKQCYSFYNIDRVYDPLLAAGVRPIVELSFMPKAIANCDLDVCADSPCAKNNTCTPCRHGFSDGGSYKGAMEMPPGDYEDWYNLIFALGTHMVERHGLAEVSTWHWCASKALDICV